MPDTKQNSLHVPTGELSPRIARLSKVREGQRSGGI